VLNKRNPKKTQEAAGKETHRHKLKKYLKDSLKKLLKLLEAHLTPLKHQLQDHPQEEEVKPPQ